MLKGFLLQEMFRGRRERFHIVDVGNNNHHLGVATAVLAVLMPFATPSPSIPSPIMTPRMGPGNTMTAKNPVAIKPYITPTRPLAASNPATINDLCFHETRNAAVASTMAPMPGHGASPVCSAPPLRVTVRNTTSVATASPTANTSFEFVMAQSSTRSILDIVHS